MNRLMYVFACLGVFALGAYVWRIKNTGVALVVADERPPAEAFRDTAVIAEVGDERISHDDVEWEYEVVTAAIDAKETLTAVPDLGTRFDAEMAPLRKELISALIERKLLFRFVQQDRTFKFDDPSRYSACLTEWQENLESDLPALTRKDGKERLKARLCERSIIDQYMKERLFADVTVEEHEIVEYYKNHLNEFKLPERVEIRHILLGDEQEAKRVRHQATAANFADLAKNRSLAPEAVRGGRLPPFALGEMPTVFDLAFRMRRGDISDVQKSNYGYHLIMLLAKHEKKDLGLDEARPLIIKALRQKKETEAYRQWVDRALASISVTTPKSTTW